MIHYIYNIALWPVSKKGTQDKHPMDVCGIKNGVHDINQSKKVYES